MTQLGAKQEQDARTLLMEVLHVIADHREPGDSVSSILQSACILTGAKGGCFYLFNEPRLLIGWQFDTSALEKAEDFPNQVAGLANGVHINPRISDEFVSRSENWLIAPIRSHKNVVVSVLLLVFDEGVALSEGEEELLLALVDGLKIITTHARSTARHEKLSRNQSEFTRIVSHDLRSPLTYMQGFASMLEANMEGTLTEKQLYYVEKILTGIAQMTALVDNIQDAGRFDPETGFYEMERAQCDLVEMVQRIVANHIVPAEKQELTISVKTADDVPIIFADHNMLERALINLVDNAIKYTPNGGHIDVGVMRHDHHIILSVADDGYGISPENQKRLFERHVRIPRREHKRIKGSGLGLFIVSSVAQRHNGRAWVESAEGQGSTFYISIPLDGLNLHMPEESSTPA